MSVLSENWNPPCF